MKSPPSLATRPTADKLRETLFNILTPRIEGSHFLDLCAGSGAVGIEAISRGASHVTFVERSRALTELIQSNLSLCRAGESSYSVVTAVALRFLDQRSRRAEPSFDLIYFDPPYADAYSPTLEKLGDEASPLVGTGWLIAEHDRRRELPELIGKLHRFRILKQGDSALSFFSLTEALEGEES